MDYPRAVLSRHEVGDRYVERLLAHLCKRKELLIFQMLKRLARHLFDYFCVVPKDRLDPVLDQVQVLVFHADLCIGAIRINSQSYV